MNNQDLEEIWKAERQQEIRDNFELSFSKYIADLEERITKLEKEKGVKQSGVL